MGTSDSKVAAVNPSAMDAEVAANVAALSAVEDDVGRRRRNLYAAAAVADRATALRATEEASKRRRNLYAALLAGAAFATYLWHTRKRRRGEGDTCDPDGEDSDSERRRRRRCRRDRERERERDRRQRRERGDNRTPGRRVGPGPLPRIVPLPRVVRGVGGAPRPPVVKTAGGLTAPRPGHRLAFSAPLRSQGASQAFEAGSTLISPNGEVALVARGNRLSLVRREFDANGGPLRVSGDPARGLVSLRDFEEVRSWRGIDRPQVDYRLALLFHEDELEVQLQSAPTGRAQEESVWWDSTPQVLQVVAIPLSEFKAAPTIAWRVTNGGAAVYSIEAGGEAIVVSQPFADAYPLAGAAAQAFPDGAPGRVYLARGEADGRFYRVEGGRKRWIQTLDFSNFASELHPLSPEAAAALANGPAIARVASHEDLAAVETEAPPRIRANHFLWLQDEVLKPGDARLSSSGLFTLAEQVDGNLALRFASRVTIWSSGAGAASFFSAGATAVLQRDGNVVQHSFAGKNIWQAGPSAFGARPDGLYVGAIDESGALSVWLAVPTRVLGARVWLIQRSWSTAPQSQPDTTAIRQKLEGNAIED